MNIKKSSPGFTKKKISLLESVVTEEDLKKLSKKNILPFAFESENISDLTYDYYDRISGRGDIVSGYFFYKLSIERLIIDFIENKIFFDNFCYENGNVHKIQAVYYEDKLSQAKFHIVPKRSIADNLFSADYKDIAKMQMDTIEVFLRSKYNTPSSNEIIDAKKKMLKID